MGKGYAAAISSSISVALTLRMLTSGMTKRAKGTQLLLLNTFVGCTAGAAASFCNTFFMRRAEVEKGINVYSDEPLTKPAGISKKCAESAVIETALSRSAMSFMCVTIPAALILALNTVGVRPKSAVPKNLMEISCVSASLLFGLPLSVAIFPPKSMLKGIDLEPEFHQHKEIYFNKGL